MVGAYLLTMHRAFWQWNVLAGLILITPPVLFMVLGMDFPQLFGQILVVVWILIVGFAVVADEAPAEVVNLE